MWWCARRIPPSWTPESYFFDPNTLDGSIVDTEKIRAYMQGAHPRVNQLERLYTDEEDLDAAALAASPILHLTPARVEAALQKGPHFVALSGHGYWGGCCAVDAALAMKLTNGTRSSIIFADSCLTAQVDVEDSLGEVIVTRASGGAVAYVGYTRWGWIGTGTEFQQDFFKQLWAQRHLGLMVDAARRMWTNGRYGRWHALGMMLFGCPEMPVFRDDNDAKPSFIGNTGSKELHERFCPWVRRMSIRNQVVLSSKSAALAAGYDGCGFCMREYHTR